MMHDWFQQDDNAVPPVHVLQPITSKLKYYYNDKEPERRQQDRARWWEIFTALQSILRRAADCAVNEGVRSKEEMHKYQFSGELFILYRS